MAADFSRCSSRECHITGYDVVVEEGADSGTVQVSITDPCNTLSRPCDAKAILVKVYRDWVESIAGDTDLISACVYNDKCPSGGPGMAFYYGTKTLIVTTSETAPVSPLTTTVALPISCDVSVFA